MQIKAQSLVPVDISYLHIGYGAAAAFHTKAGGTLLLFFAGAILIARLKRKPVILKLAIGLAAFTTIGGIHLISDDWLMMKIEPEKMTLRYAQHSYYNMWQLVKAKKPVPTNIRLLCLNQKYMKDSWGVEYRVEKRPSTECGYIILSAGRDRKFSTKDDLRFPPDDQRIFGPAK